MSPEDYKILQERVNQNSISKKDREGLTGHTCPILVESKVAVTKSPQKSRSKGSKAKGEMELVIKAMFPEYKKEFEFAKNRRYRADWYIESIGVLVEYEGIFTTAGEMNGHTSWKSYTKDADKYNLAQILGFKGLRYTYDNYKNMGADLWQLKYGVNG